MSAQTNHWWVYIICASDDRLYTGITTDIRRRWQQHLNGKQGAKFFRGRQPQRLCLLEPQADRSDASKREAAIKKLSRRQKLQLIDNQSAPYIDLITEFMTELSKAAPDSEQQKACR